MINSIKPYIMQVYFFYNRVLPQTIFINDYGVLKLIINNKLNVVISLQMYGVLYGAIFTKSREAL